MTQVVVLQKLQQALRRLPGVGPKSAQRMAFHLLERDREGGQQIAAALNQALSTIQKCRRCQNFSESELCGLCSSPRRDASQLCIVETPADLAAVEQSGAYKGLYFVLMGQLSPLDGIGPDEMGVDKLEQLLKSATIKEVILATNLTTEGQATADFLGEFISGLKLPVSRLARGLPIGGELEYLDHATVTQAFADRKPLTT